MKKYLYLLIVVLQSLLLNTEAVGAPCASSSLSDYVALGSAGCTVGGLRFSNFASGMPQTGATMSTAISVTPVMVGSTVVGVSFGVSPTTSGGGFFDDLIFYRVTGVASSITGATVDFTGSDSTGDAAVSVSSQLCLGGTYAGADGVSGCTGINGPNLAVVNIGGIADPAYSQSFAPTGFLSVASNLTFDSGSGEIDGSSSALTSGINLYSFVGVRAVPEPASSLLIAAGVLALALSRRRRSS